MAAVELDREQWQQMKAVLTRALRVPASARVALLEEEFADDVFLRDCALEMLRHYDTATRRLDSGGSDLADALPPGPPVSVGRLLGHYRVLRKLGEGGMGIVYLAEDERLRRQVALKFIGASIHGTVAEAKAQLLAESRSTAVLNHPGIVTLHDVFEADGELVAVMEFVEGRPLNEMIAGHPLPLGFALRLVSQLADALSYAHGRGILHCDLKPANIHVMPNGAPKILDFGLARALGDSGTGVDAQDKAFFGTPGYIAPERLLGRAASAASDVYALGVIFFEVVTGIPPFRADDQGQLFLDTVTATPPPPSATAAGIPTTVDDIVLRCLAKNPRERLQAHEIARSVSSALSQLETSHETQGAAAPAPATPTGGRAWAYLRVLAGVLVLSVLSGLLTSWTFNAVIERPFAMDPESTVRRIIGGLQSLLLPALVISGTAGILSVVQVAATLAYQRLGRSRAPARSTARPHALIPAAAQTVVVAGFVAVGLLFFVFGDLISTFTGRLGADAGGTLRPLQPEYREHQLYFRIVTSGLLGIWLVGWRTVEVRAAANGVGVPAGARAGAMTLLVLMFLLLQSPYKLTVQNELPVGIVDGQRCHILGTDAAYARVYCPGWPVPRVRTVSLATSPIADCGFEENVFIGAPLTACR